MLRFCTALFSRILHGSVFREKNPPHAIRKGLHGAGKFHYSRFHPACLYDDAADIIFRRNPLFVQDLSFGDNGACRTGLGPLRVSFQMFPHKGFSAAALSLNASAFYSSHLRVFISGCFITAASWHFISLSGKSVFSIAPSIGLSTPLFSNFDGIFA